MMSFTHCLFMFWGSMCLALLPVCAQAQLEPLPATPDKAILLSSAVLHEDRSIWVHLPADYDATTTTTYPVLYVLDGDAHFKYVAALVDYLADYDRNRIPPLIVVGIPNVARGRDLTPPPPASSNAQVTRRATEGSGGAAGFLQFLQQELVPFMDQHYRTQPYRLLLGHSLAGLFALYAKEQAPNLFPATVLISPALTGAPQVLTAFQPFLQQHPQLSGKLVVTIGNENTAQVDSLVQQLRAAAPKSFHWHYQHYPAENHFSVPVPSIGEALKFIYATWFLDFYATTRLSYPDIQAHFAALSREFGYPIAPTEDFVNNCGYRQLRLGNLPEAVDLFKQNVAHHPASANAYDSLGEAYLKQGNKALAIRNYQKSVTLNPANENARAVLQKLTVKEK